MAGSDTMITITTEQIRALVGETTYAKGMTYYRQNKVHSQTLAGGVIEGQVQGSKEYSTGITVVRGKLVPRCSCPAGQRKMYWCSHAAALLIAWANVPGSFASVQPTSHSLAEIKARLDVPARRIKREVPQRSQLIRGGLDVLESLLYALSYTGTTALTAGQLETLSNLIAVVRAQKLHRLARLLEALHVEIGHVLHAPSEFDQGTYVELLCDIWYTAAATRRFLAQGAFDEGGTVTGSEQRELEQLVGHTWRESELQPLAPRKLIELGYESYTTTTGFHWTVSILIDPASGELFQQRESARAVDFRPVAARKPYPLPVLLLRGLRYPCDVPDRIRILEYRLADEWTLHDIVQTVRHAYTAFEPVYSRFAAMLHNPLRDPYLYALLRPVQILKVHSNPARIVFVDAAGASLPVDDHANPAFEAALQRGVVDAIFGKIILNSTGPAPLTVYPLSILRTTLPRNATLLANPLVQRVG